MQQDWAPVILHKRPANASAARSSGAVNAARATGGSVETVNRRAGNSQVRYAAAAAAGRRCAWLRCRTL